MWTFIRSVLLSGMLHTVKYAAWKRRVPAALYSTASAPASHGIRPPSCTPSAPAPVLGMRRGQHARALLRSLLADPSRPGQRHTRHPFNPLSEEKAVRSLRIDIVTEKNQKNEKLLTDKTGRFVKNSA